MNSKYFFVTLFLVAGFALSLFFSPHIEAACNYPAYCDAPAGTCGSTCNGGNSCYIGNTVCTGEYDPSTCGCSDISEDTKSCNISNVGSNCSPVRDQYGTPTGSYAGPGICQCNVVRPCTCSDTHQATCCSAGGGCGWSDWSTCSAPCGGGTQLRTNTCNGTSETRACNTQACPQPTPTPGAPTPPPCYWNPWSACSPTTCTKSRTNSCGGSPEVVACTDVPQCVPNECEITAWSACSATCGVGTQTRTNTCVAGGIETQACSTCDNSPGGCSCTSSCGQSTACGTCSGADFGLPGPITLTPSSGNLQLPPNQQVTLSWTPADKGDNYDIQIFPTGTPAGQECTAANTVCATGLTTTSYTFTAPLGVANYSWRVKANNITCNVTSFMSATASNEYLTAEGAAYNMVAGAAIDNNPTTMWNAGAFPTQWIELDLKNARTVTGIQMHTGHSPAGNETFQIYVGSTPNPTTLAYSTTTYITPGDQFNLTFASSHSNVRYMRIVTTASNSWVGWTQLTPLYSDGLGSWTNGNFTLVGPVSGNIYLDQGFTASQDLDGKCVAGPLPGQNPGAPSSIQANWISGGNITGSITDSTYTVNNIPNYGQIGLNLSPDSNLWRCTCPNNCVYPQGPSGFDLHETANFYIASVSQPWWSSRNGLIYGGNTSGNSIISLIPDTCTGPTCPNRLSNQNLLSASESSGITITGGGDIDTDQSSTLRYTKLRDDSSQARIIGSTYNGPRENYQYFYNLYSMGTSPAVDFDGSKPDTAPVNNRAYYASGDVTLNTSWNVAADESIVVFVNGNLTIDGTTDQTNINVEDGGFLAFIVSGNINVSNNVGWTDISETTSNIEGVYIGDRFIVEGGRAGGDYRFNGEGTFVGWTGIAMNRTFNDLLDYDNTPSEFFTFRPDFVLNVPERMTRPLYTWQETN